MYLDVSTPFHHLPSLPCVAVAAQLAVMPQAASALYAAPCSQYQQQSVHTTSTSQQHPHPLSYAPSPPPHLSYSGAPMMQPMQLPLPMQQLQQLPVIKPDLGGADPATSSMQNGHWVNFGMLDSTQDSLLRPPAA